MSNRVAKFDHLFSLQVTRKMAANESRVPMKVTRGLLNLMKSYKKRWDSWTEKEHFQIMLVLPNTEQRDLFAFFLRWKKIPESTRDRVKRVQLKENAWARGRSWIVTPRDPEHNAEAKQRAKELKRIRLWAKQDQEALATASASYDAEGLTKKQRAEREKVRLEALAAERAAAGPLPPQQRRYLVGMDPEHDKVIRERARAKAAERTRKWRENKRGFKVVSTNILFFLSDPNQTSK